jgi:hypothetical protein
MGKAKDHRHPSAIAWLEWETSKEGQGCLDATILFSPHHHQYLRNRLMRTWQAAWDAAKKASER